MNIFLPAMIDIQFQPAPMEIGETRALKVVTGHAPFTVKVSRFVNQPRLIGTQPCEQYPVCSLNENEPFEIKADQNLWNKINGGFQIDIADARGERRRIHINVRPRNRSLFAS